MQTLQHDGRLERVGEFVQAGLRRPLAASRAADGAEGVRGGPGRDPRGVPRPRRDRPADGRRRRPRGHPQDVHGHAPGRVPRPAADGQAGHDPRHGFRALRGRQDRRALERRRRRGADGATQAVGARGGRLRARRTRSACFNCARCTRHADQRALVTGGTSGIGEAIVTRLAADGARVVFTGRDEQRGAAVAQRTGAEFVRADARDGRGRPRVGAGCGGAARRSRRRGSQRRRALRGDALGDDRRAVGHRHVDESRRALSLRPGDPAGVAGDQRLDGAGRLRCRRLGRDADRRLLRLEARGDHAHAHARGRGRARPGARERSLSRRHRAGDGDDRRRARGAARHLAVDAPAARAPRARPRRRGRRRRSSRATRPGRSRARTC